MKSKFYIGQKIIATRDNSKKIFKKDQCFIVLDVKQSCCGVLIKVFENAKWTTQCSWCGADTKRKGYVDQISFSEIK